MVAACGASVSLFDDSDGTEALATSGLLADEDA